MNINIDTLLKTAQNHIDFMLIGFGILLIIAGIRNWKWLIEPQGMPSFGFLYWLNTFWGHKGYRVGCIIIGILIIICGIAMSIFKTS